MREINGPGGGQPYDRPIRRRALAVADGDNLVVGLNGDAVGAIRLAEVDGHLAGCIKSRVEIAGRRAFVAHGDGIAEQHWSAMVMHHVTRHPLTIRMFRALHPDLGFWIAHQLSRKLADNTRDGAVLERAARAQSAFASELLGRRADLGLVVLAHTHRPALEQLGNGRVYLNPGAFLDGGRYAVVTKDSVELRTFP